MTRSTAYSALLLRLSLGAIFLAHGAVMKLGTFGLAGTMGYFGSIGLPPVLGALVALGETAAGLALISGVLVRTASLATLPIALGAVWAHAANGWVFSAPGGGWEFPAFLAAALLVQAGLGAGAHALDPRGLLGRRAAPQAA
ncbi:DoxX family protein [Roseococcus sp. SYP-B2431]|uniref:DoxX family protein n=1 Tax=Roseococcus sp. SYP-B2431 TaxID=2496640 RepID=UPI00103D879F|nr:DoxX family protein [Roseococcus sp. SYP-B2431]TCH96678.1 DoxX family protein [Roseococcus sp. SYP-B2431]